MNQILEKQNEPMFLQYLAAQRQLYNEEKGLISIWMVVSTLIALLGSSSLAFLSPIAAFITLGAILVLLGELYTYYIIRKRGETAASIQELFDCELLEIPWNDYGSQKPKMETIVDAAARYQKQATPEEVKTLINWYESDLADLPMHKARIVCQQENIRWDKRLRQEYIRWMIIALFIIALLLVIISIVANWSARDFFSGPVLLMLPVFALGIKHINDHYKAIARLIELNVHVDNLLRVAEQGNMDPAVVTQQSRQLQDQIFRHRAENPPVFNWFYERIRKKYQKKGQA